MINLELPHDELITDFVDIPESDADKYKRKGYLFSQWVTISGAGHGTMRLVLPHKKAREAWDNIMGYPLKAMIPREHYTNLGNYNWVMHGGPIDFTFSAIAGEMADCDAIYKHGSKSK